MLYLNDLTPMSLRICAMKYFEPNEFHITRVHRYSVLILMLDGVLRFFEEGELFELRAGEYYIQRAGLLQEGINLHRMQNSDAPAVYYFIEFQGGEYSETDSGLPIRGKFQPADMRPLINACNSVAMDRHCVNPFLLNSYMYRMFSELYTDLQDNHQVSRMLSMVRRTIDSEYASISDIDMVAQKFGYNSDYLTKLFYKKYQVTPFQYLKKVRMEHAMWLLLNSTVPLTQIAGLIGYNNYSSFYRAFLAAYRTPPGDILREPGEEIKEKKKKK